MDEATRKYDRREEYMPPSPQPQTDSLWKAAGERLAQPGNYNSLCAWSEAGMPDDPAIPLRWEAR